MVIGFANDSTLRGEYQEGEESKYFKSIAAKGSRLKESDSNHCKIVNVGMK